MTDIDIATLNKKSEELNKRIAETAVLLDRAVRRVGNYEQTAAERIQESDALIKKQLETIEDAILELKECLTSTGLSKINQLVEDALQKNKAQFEIMQHAGEDFQKMLDESIIQLQQNAENISNWIAESVKSLKFDDFRSLIISSVHQIDELTTKSVSKINCMTRWFHWEKVALCIGSAIIAAFLTALFINDESPITKHQEAVQEREAGRLFFKVWPRLTPAEKQHIKQAAASSHLI